MKSVRLALIFLSERSVGRIVEAMGRIESAVRVKICTKMM